MSVLFWNLVVDDKSSLWPKRIRVAIVADGDAAFGLTRMFQALRSDSSTELTVFRDVAEARSWLGLDDD